MKHAGQWFFEAHQRRAALLRLVKAAGRYRRGRERDVIQPPIVVRVARAADVPALSRLRRAWREEYVGPIDDERFDTAFVDWVDAEGDRRVFFLAEQDSRPVGMLNLAVFTRMPSPGRPSVAWGYVGNVFVLEADRNRRTGRLLLDGAVEYARRTRFVRLVLNPSPRSIPYYERAGFVRSGLLELDLGS